MSILDTAKTVIGKFLSIQEVKAQALVYVDEAVSMVEEFTQSTKGKEKKDLATAYLMSKIELPLFLKPFKGVVKGIISNFIDNLVEDAVNRLKQRTNK